MDVLRKTNRVQAQTTDFYEATLYELLAEASERICSLYRTETGRELNAEVVTLTFEDGQITEIRSDINEIIFEI